MNSRMEIPVLDVEALVSRSKGRERVAEQIRSAGREHGFFYVVGHGVDERLQFHLEALSRRFFARSVGEKLKIQMKLGGRAWRGYFPVGQELTSGDPDQKEGIYFGTELDETDPRVCAGIPLHGANLFPENLEDFREAVLDYMDAVTRLGHALTEGIALSLGLDGSYFHDRYTSEPLVLFRIFNYPALAESALTEKPWSVGEHSDYGFLTILRQDDSGGLQVKSHMGWIEAPPVPNSFVCNIGDMLDRMTGGLYRSTPHRVRNVSGQARLSFPLFFDPNFNARVEPIDSRAAIVDDKKQRWDQMSVHAFEGTYGDYLLDKVSKVFPELGNRVL